MAMSNYIKKIYNSKKKFFTNQQLQELLEINKKNTQRHVARNLTEKNILTRLERGKYYITDTQPSDFEIAQFLYTPSYISFETALNYHGILSQFPMEITSATLKKSKTKKIEDKIYTYSQLKPELYFGYYKKTSKSLMALPEKALLDQVYLISKKLKTENYLNELDFSKINENKLKKYSQLFPNEAFNLIKKYL